MTMSSLQEVAHMEDGLEVKPLDLRSTETTHFIVEISWSTVPFCIKMLSVYSDLVMQEKRRRVSQYQISRSALNGMWIKIITLCMQGKHFSRRHLEILLLFFTESRIWHFMQIVS